MRATAAVTLRLEDPSTSPVRPANAALFESGLIDREGDGILMLCSFVAVRAAALPLLLDALGGS